ncbi:MAG: SsgA family sporulation/cell division regulator [Frankiaceae bacterium]|nr:SsgA family sporulation/cell division regulator [Frankiaceae bacterium]
MTTRPTSVSSELQLRLVVPGAAALPVRADLDYDVTDPYAVTVAFHTGAAGGDVVQWTFARQLLSDGVSVPAGEGDVQVWPSAGDTGAVVCLSLSSPSGRALFEVPLGDLMEFLGRTYQAVPTGGESSHVDVDAELALLLWAEPET